MIVTHAYSVAADLTCSTAALRRRTDFLFLFVFALLDFSANTPERSLDERRTRSLGDSRKRGIGYALSLAE